MKIRLTSILLAVFMVFGLMLNTGVIFAHDDFPGAVRDNANVPTENAKEVVFLIDRSMYTDYNALADIKNQVSDLSDQLLQAGNFSISVIAFNGNVTTLVRQSTDLNKIKNSLRYISPFGFSNPSLALEVANGIRYEEKKDVVLFTNVYPNLGTISNKGPFTYRDHFYFRNANGFKNSADLLAENTRLITVSNFSNLNNRDYAFAKRVFEENSDKYYAADKMNSEELVSSVRDYILGDEKHDRNLDKKPIIFIPGIAGSELFKIDESLVSPEEKAIGMIYGDKERSANRIWVPIGYDARKANDDLNLYSNENLYGLQQGDLRKVNVFERHAGPVAMYSSLLGTIMKNFPDRPVYLFSYDWRKSNIDSAEKLAAFIDSITDGGKVKVDIIAHSMGGIVSSHYLREHDDRVDKYLSFGSPYEGAPSAFNTLSSKSLVGGFLDVVIEKLVGIKPDVASSFTAMVELLPTQRMLEKYPYHFVSTGDLNSFQRILNSNSSYDKILQAAADAKVSGLADLATVDMAMSNVSNDRYNQFIEDSKLYRVNGERNGDVLLMHRPNSMFFVGNNHPTVVSGYFPGNQDILHTVYGISTPEGDGMVPLYSATMGMTFEEMSPEIRNKFRVVKGDHIGMLLDLGNLQMMCDFLNGREVR
ncbi:von Willebrand factor type A domain-containing protein [Ezakiella coagulans]|uniref:von Willebrand factor type A domain-containing protein n=1 Tax=Ezakiella coagulans TaxID=46507 RepID=A0A2U1DNE8_9FIRM|nr:VWA domain-containing protein [Ezakiella coagulans]PVY89201.1 von Willebrand factor type A domain-containing protein [Ezakiella coagulans]